jgi:hypothetical protein
LGRCAKVCRLFTTPHLSVVMAEVLVDKGSELSFTFSGFAFGCLWAF